MENFFIGDSLSTCAQPITAITRRGLLVVVVAGSGLARYTEIALPLDKRRSGSGAVALSTAAEILPLSQYLPAKS